ncbi:MAG TPA: carbohydrate-binding family 9-like protein, partial [Acidobacteriaceae bacterium]|nr:carbohydrate-binding family 9-like protein [Acidobacteriaceae bacterium]
MNHALPQAFSNFAEYDSAPEVNPLSDFWRDTSITPMSDDAYGNKVSGHATEIRSRWTCSNLYFLFVCHYQELHLRPNPVLDKPTGGLWNWDVAEAFIGPPDGPIDRYKEFEMSPQGEWLDLDIDLKQPDKVALTSWTSGIQVAARIQHDQKIWYGSMRIPYASLEAGEAEAGKVLRINFFRSQGTMPVEMAWQPPQQASFHAPEK